MCVDPQLCCTLLLPLSGLSDTSRFGVARIIVSYFVALTVPTVFLIPFYWMSGLRQEAGTYTCELKAELHLRGLLTGPFFVFVLAVFGIFLACVSLSLVRTMPKAATDCSRVVAVLIASHAYGRAGLACVLTAFLLLRSDSRLLVVCYQCMLTCFCPDVLRRPKGKMGWWIWSYWMSVIRWYVYIHARRVFLTSDSFLSPPSWFAADTICYKGLRGSGREQLPRG